MKSRDEAISTLSILISLTWREGLRRLGFRPESLRFAAFVHTRCFPGRLPAPEDFFALARLISLSSCFVRNIFYLARG